MAVDKESLASQIKGKVLTEGDDGFEAQLKRWADNAERKAGFIALVESPEDISKTVYTESNCKVTLDLMGH
jgi:hypothetical protein